MCKYVTALVNVFLMQLFLAASAFSQQTKPFLKDRGPGIPTSMWGTYISKGEIILYPFYEYYYDKNAEYKPSDFGHDVAIDYRGLYKAHEGLIYAGFGISHSLMFEMETSVISARQYKSADDNSTMPAYYEESGIGDIECQVRWRYFTETVNRPEWFSYFETVFPFQKNKKLIGTQDWELKLGTGIIKGYAWGTLMVRVAAEYTAGENKFDLGEYAIEYLKKVSEKFRFLFAIEGNQDEVSLINDLQFHLKPWMFIRVNNGIGLTSKATDYAPELGLVFYLNKK